VSLANVFEDSIDTDITQEEYDDFIKLAKKMEHAKLDSVVLDAGDTLTERPGLLEFPETREDFGGQWVIVPRAGSGNFSEIQSYVQCELTVGNCTVTPTKTPEATEQ
jgi:hypothetical protein